MRKFLIPSALLSLCLGSINAVAADKVPSAMKTPVDSTTVPAATTGKDLGNDPSADNTSRNTVHDGDKAVSADQQSNDKADVEITRKIRQAIVKDDALSTYAHNVKIITVKGSVVLKGPVRSNEEKAKVESIASKIAGRDKLVSEIEVSAK